MKFINGNINHEYNVTISLKIFSFLIFSIFYIFHIFFCSYMFLKYL